MHVGSRARTAPRHEGRFEVVDASRGSKRGRDELEQGAFDLHMYGGECSR